MSSSPRRPPAPPADTTRYLSRQMTDEGQEDQDTNRDQRTIPAITDWACCSLAGLGAVVALTVVVVMVLWHAGPRLRPPVS
jgi:hypothetical protein